MAGALEWAAAVLNLLIAEAGADGDRQCRDASSRGLLAMTASACPVRMPGSCSKRRRPGAGVPRRRQRLTAAVLTAGRARSGQGRYGVAKLLRRPGFDWRRDGDALVRRRKAAYFDKPVLPSVNPLGERLVAYLCPG